MGMRSTEESIALQAVEFWSTIAEEEIDLAIDAAEVCPFPMLCFDQSDDQILSPQAQDYGEMPENESKYFCKVALPEIMPVLLSLLTRQDEDAEDDEWTVSMAAGTCLTLLSQAVGDAIVSAAIPFIESNIKSPDWHQREAAVMTFGSILDGPDPNVTQPLVAQALPLLIEMMQDQNTLVKDTTAWTLGRICDLLIVAIKLDTHLHSLVSALVSALEDKPRIVANCCWALMNLSDQLGAYAEEEGTATSPLSPYYGVVVQALLHVTAGYAHVSYK